MMKTKKDVSQAMKAIGEFNLKADNDGKQLIIEGFANKAVTDRIGDLIPPDAWELESFKDNPIIFFNHDRNIPIGKALDVKTTDDGLMIKVRISKSNQAPIPFVRDMIEEGILKTFSVGFDDHQSSTKDNEGNNVFKRAELLETSVVTIPMNQASTFDIVAKMIDDKGVHLIKSKAVSDYSKWKEQTYQEVASECLSAKGAHVAAIVKRYCDIDSEMRGDLEKEFSKDLVDDILAGNVIPAPSEFVATASKLFGLPLAELQAINKDDDDEDQEEEDEKDPAAKGKEGEEEDDKEDENEEKSEDQEKADFQECVTSNIPKLMEDGMERDAAVAAAISSCQEGKSCNLQPSTDDYKKFFSIADGDTQEKQEDSDPASGTSILPNDDPSDIGQPALDLQKSSLSLQGATLEQTKALKEAQDKTNELLTTLVELIKNKPITQEFPKEDEEEEEEEEKAGLEVVIEDGDDDEDEDEEREKKLKSLTAKVEKAEKIQEYHDRLNRLLGA
jgi:HK97 family phage prohead protease